MEKIIFGNHSALRVHRSERKRIRSFYVDVLGGRLMRSFDDKDDIRIGGNYYISFLYGTGNGRGADKGVNYASAEVLGQDDFLKAVFLELMAADEAAMRQKITGFGVRVLDVPDPHLYFQAPGGQVYRLVGIGENLAAYEGTAL